MVDIYSANIFASICNISHREQNSHLLYIFLKGGLKRDLETRASASIDIVQEHCLRN